MEVATTTVEAAVAVSGTGMAWWDWAGIVMGAIGVVAFVMAVQPFVQMIWGAPKIVVAFGEDTVGEIKMLHCHIANFPVKGKLLRFLKVRRSVAEDVWAPFEILEHQTGEKVFDAVPVINTFTGTAAQRVTLPSSTVGGTFGVANITVQGQVYAGLERTTELAVGLCDLSMRVDIEGDPKRKYKHSFVVQQKESYAYWVSSA